VVFLSNERSESTLDLWNRAADRYSGEKENGSDICTSIYLPIIDRWIGDIQDRRILDAGCGDGWYAERLAQKGGFVTGIDGSPEMIRIACLKNTHPRVTYRIMDLTKPLALESSSVDIIIANMVLMDIPAIDLCLAEFSRILKPDGIFIFSITHPSFFCSDWVLDASGMRSYKIVRDYLHEKQEILNFWGKTIHYHRPLSYYIQRLERAGMCLLSLSEPIPEILEGEKDSHLESHFRIPSFIVIKTAVLGTSTQEQVYK
jgi:2-polyprenyl-3-methyl-5-hydroxy-6-metoxy-1,4-benzoquinol methylase